MSNDRIAVSSALRALMLAVLVAGLGGCARPEKKIDPAELRSALESGNTQFTDAFARRDAAAIGQLYAEDAQAFPPGAPLVTGRTAIEEMWRGILGMPVGRIQLQTVEVDGAADSTAWESGRYTLMDTTGATMDEGKYVVVWKRDAAGWKLYRDIWNSNLPPQPAATPAPGSPSAGKP